jgi:hypothetical protein
MTNPNTTAAARAHAVTIAGLEGQWAKASGGVPSVAVSESWNGGAAAPDLTLGRVTYSNLTTERPFNPMRDRAMIRFLESSLGTGWTTTITDQDLDANASTVGEPVVFTGCVPVTVTGPEFDTNSSDGSTVSIEWKIQSKV